MFTIIFNVYTFLGSLSLSLYIYIYIYIYTNSSVPAGRNTKLIFERSVIDLNSVFSFSYPGCLTK